MKSAKQKKIKPLRMNSSHPAKTPLLFAADAPWLGA